MANIQEQLVQRRQVSFLEKNRASRLVLRHGKWRKLLGLYVDHHKQQLKVRRIMN